MLFVLLGSFLLFDLIGYLNVQQALEIATEARRRLTSQENAALGSETPTGRAERK